jgi:uncharacterized membrane protein YqaE (UPF0057 family)
MAWVAGSATLLACFFIPPSVVLLLFFHGSGSWRAEVWVSLLLFTLSESCIEEVVGWDVRERRSIGQRGVRRWQEVEERGV